MREELANRNGLRGRFTATFVRFGKKRGFGGRPPIDTALFRDVRDEAGQLAADHLWFTVGVQMRALDLQANDQVAFEARVSAYWKGYVSGRYDDDNWQPRTKDYRLSFPTQLRKISAEPQEASLAALPLFAQEEA